MTATATINKLALEFAKVINNYLTKEELTTVNERNQTPDYSTACATHDFCDANQAMIDAWITVMKKDIDFQSEEDIETINKAWNIAKANQFKIS